MKVKLFQIQLTAFASFEIFCVPNNALTKYKGLSKGVFKSSLLKINITNRHF